MTTVYDVDASELIEKAAEELKKVNEIKAPSWASFVKTGMHKERPPIKKDWWYTRCAAVLRSVYTRGPVGTSKLRTKYGGKKNLGHRPDHFFRASGAILRKALQQLEKAGLVEQVSKKGNKGRMVSAKGKAFMDKIASKIVLSGKKAEPKAEKPMVVEKKVEQPKIEEKTTEEKPKPAAQVAEAKPEEKKEAKPKKTKAAAVQKPAEQPA